MKWTWGVGAALSLALLSAYPQGSLTLNRWPRWQGTYATLANDEMAYSGYLNALIQGKPRRFNPLTAKEGRGESLFSIQFVPAYLLALPARVVGASAVEVFIALPPIVAFLSTLLLFYLIAVVTDNNAAAVAGSICVLCLGTLAGGDGEGARFVTKHLHLMPSGIWGFPFLRRYQPAATFPLFFLFCALIWRSLIGRKARFCSVLAGVTFVLLVFSYLYLWTAAAAWLVSVSVVWLIFRKQDRRILLKVLVPTLGLGAIGLIVYGIMLANRAESTDRAIILAASRMPDITPLPVVIGLLLLVGLAIGMRRGLVPNEPPTIFASSFALLPLLLFNQQIVSGYVLQPFHYGKFIGNYVVVLAAVVTLTILLQRARQRISQRYLTAGFALLAGVALLFGFVEVRAYKHILPYDTIRDHIPAVGNKLIEYAKEAKQDDQGLIFSASDVFYDNVSTFAPQGVLWASHMFNADLSVNQRKERYFQQLYYSGVSATQFKNQLDSRMAEPIIALWGFDRIDPSFTPRFRPLTQGESQEAYQDYAKYTETFSFQQAATFPIKYVVTYTKPDTNLSNIDRWYERDSGDVFGVFKLYRVKLRTR